MGHEKQEYFIIDNKGLTSIECEWMELGGVDKVYVEASEIWKREDQTRTRIDAYAFVLQGGDDISDHTGLPIPMYIKTTPEHMHVFYAEDMEEAAKMAYEENGKEYTPIVCEPVGELGDEIYNPFADDEVVL